MVLASDDSASGRKGRAYAFAVLMLVSLFAVSAAQVGGEQGVPDAYGYAWTDSDSPLPVVDYNWVEIRTTGIDSGTYGDDNWFGPFPIGFSFEFYGMTYSEFFASTNGFISFNTAVTTNPYSNVALPTATLPTG